MALAYLTDVEGQWEKVATFAARNPCVRLDAAGHLDVADGAAFVFGGDAIDRGPAGRRVVRALLDVKERRPEAVALIAGNRDINKLRLARELAGFPPTRTPGDVKQGPRADLLRWIFANTMAAPQAFEHRRTELAVPLSDDDVAQSFLDDLAPDGALVRYLAACKLAHRAGSTLFVHGAVTPENLFTVPGAAPATSLEEWIERLNAWYAASVTSYREGAFVAGEPAWSSLVAYQAPLPGTRLNQASVVYGRLADDLGNPRLPAPSVIAALERAGITRLVVGHTPSGDTPSVLVQGSFELVMADNSYGRVGEGSVVVVDDAGVAVRGVAELEDRAREEVTAGSRDPFVGKTDEASGQLVKGRLASGDYLLYRGLPGYRIEQVRATQAELVARGICA